MADFAEMSPETDPIYCPRCGEKVRSGVAACAACGQPVTWAAPGTSRLGTEPAAARGDVDVHHRDPDENTTPLRISLATPSAAPTTPLGRRGSTMKPPGKSAPGAAIPPAKAPPPPPMTAHTGMQPSVHWSTPADMADDPSVMLPDADIDDEPAEEPSAAPPDLTFFRHETPVMPPAPPAPMAAERAPVTPPPPPPEAMAHSHAAAPVRLEEDITPSAVPVLGEDEFDPSATGPLPYQPLGVGDVVQQRFRIRHVLDATAQSARYQVMDLRAYERCWNCGDTTTGPTDKFCQQCGADLYGYLPLMAELAPGARLPDWPAAVGLDPARIVASFKERGRSYVVAPVLEAPRFPNGVRLAVGYCSDPGQIRELNEDSALSLHVSTIVLNKVTSFGFFAVADGMGGHDSGEVASSVTVNTLADRMTNDVILPALRGGEIGQGDNIEHFLQQAVHEANVAVIDMGKARHSDMGTTLVCALVLGDMAYVANVGDSRCYILEQAGLRRVSVDHSLVESLVAAGMIRRDEVYTHPNRNQIFRSLGSRPDMTADIFPQRLLPGDTLVVCCDGLWEMVRDPQMQEILLKYPDPQQAAEELVKQANANGGEDNITVVLVKALA